MPGSLIDHLEETIPTRNTHIRCFYCVNPLTYEGLSVTATNVTLSNVSVITRKVTEDLRESDLILSMINLPSVVGVSKLGLCCCSDSGLGTGFTMD